MNKLLQLLLGLLSGQKAAFAFSVLTAINAVFTGKDKVSAVVDMTYDYIPDKYKTTMTKDELKAAIKTYVAAYQATEKLFK